MFVLTAPSLRILAACRGMIAGSTLYMCIIFALNYYVMWPGLLFGVRHISTDKATVRGLSLQNTAISLLTNSMTICPPMVPTQGWSRRQQEAYPPPGSKKRIHHRGRRAAKMTTKNCSSPGFCPKKSPGGVYGILIFCGVFVYTTGHR